MARIERIADERTVTGENPLWHPDERKLYWLDIPPGRLYHYDPETNSNDIAYETPDESAIGGFTIEADGALLLFGTGGRVVRWESDSAETSVVVDGINSEIDSRFNDVIATPNGCVFCGTMPTENRLGSLYRLDTDGSITRILSDVDIANGMGFSPEKSIFYFTESEARRIYSFNYSPETGTLSTRQTFVHTPADDGIPDGMTVDADGYLWSARWNGGIAARYDPQGKLVNKLEFPARKVSCVTFGGPEHADLYVTTALGDSGSRSREGDGAGALFRVTGLPTDGVPEYRSKVTTA